MHSELSTRSTSVLDSIVERFITTGEPVGSGTVAADFPERLSSATIRSVMADLEKRGYLSQPHTSAGRLPTARGYRSYVSRLVRQGRLRRVDVGRIREQLGGSELDVSHLLQRACALLSELSAQVGMVVTPPTAEVTVQHVEFVRLGGCRALAVFVTRGGGVHSRAVELDADLAEVDLADAAERIMRRFAGCTFRDMRERLGREPARGEPLERRALALAERSLRPDLDEREVLIQGTARLLENPELTDADVLQPLFATVEDRSVLARLLTEFGDSRRPRVLIGGERLPAGLAGCALITAPYGEEGRSRGALGILGPTRMQYARTIPVVAAMARATSDRLAELYG